ncbi:glycoside hydrolase family 93 protein [Podospora didyma]|uniref:Glycoside hydrolase family 93 protein n=1 Tax=Podospora didyma TaxID=330526 RepID=A0AAE0P866_9PEZI|nr:glycoside hydrolase family 93 protein [Podospora didyma]
MLTTAAGLAMAATVQRAGDPVLIDQAGIYIRASPLSNYSANDIIAGYAAQDGRDHVLRVARSTDGAKSWQPLGEVWRADSAARDIDNAMPLKLPNSPRILYAFRNHDRIPSTGEYTHYRITVCYSEDGGRTWQFLSQVADRDANRNPGANNGLWEPFLRMAKDRSTVQVFYSSENNAHDQDNLMKYSRDGGKTWHGPIMVSGGDKSSARDGMTGVAEIDAQGNLICVFETTESGHFSINSVISHDDGYSWGSRARVYTAADNKNAGAPQVINVSGGLVASFMTNEAAPSLPEVDGGQMKVVTSIDGGRNWSSFGAGCSVAAMVTADTGAHWPGLYALDGNRFLALYSRDGLGAVSQLYRLS